MKNKASTTAEPANHIADPEWRKLKQRIKAEPFKSWLAQVSYERVKEI